MKRLIVLTSIALLFLVAVAQGISIPDPSDPAVMHIGNPPNTGTYLFGDEVRPISDTSLGILENGNGQPELLNPLLLIIGVPNKTDENFMAPAITLSTGTGTIGGTNYYLRPIGTPRGWDTDSGYSGYFQSDDVYDFIGFEPSGTASNNFGNWADADWEVVGINAEGFGIFVYSLNGTGITGGTKVDVEFASALPLGTFAVAYGQDNSKHHSFTTPFTESGMVNKVPEPSTLMLLGSGLLGVAFCLRKKLNK